MGLVEFHRRRFGVSPVGMEGIMKRNSHKTKTERLGQIYIQSVEDGPEI